MAAQAELRDKVAHLVQQHAGELDAKDRFCDEVLLALSDPLEAGSGDSGNDDDIFTLLLNPLLARLQSSNPFHSFRANKLLLEFLSSFNVVDDRLQTFFALLLQNLDPLNMCRCHSMRSHETTHALTFTLDLLQRLLKRFRRRMKQSEMDDLDPCVPILLHVLAQKSDGRVAWIEGLVYHWQHLPPKVLPYFTILIHSLLKTYRLCDGDMVAAPFRRDLLVVAQYISSYLPVVLI
ncbi:hypothetical protein BC832DRAFT_362567 [Gaertneriomyces semiglobifer]|nr:hypothetical protein BC832DRAFT_362567 [Gaertneriomyces semiglobifer]